MSGRLSVPAEAMMEPGFEEALSAFCRRHMHEFDDSEESKLAHHDLFQEYVALVEASLEARLAARLPDFDMARFLEVCPSQLCHRSAALPVLLQT